MPFLGRKRFMGWISRAAGVETRSTWSRRTILQVEPMEDRTVPSTLIPVTNHRDLVYDPIRRMLDITTSGGSILQYNPGTQGVSPLINFPGSINGAAISPDGSTLYFTFQQSPTGPYFLFALNLLNNRVATVNYTPAAGEGGMAMKG
jgi:hypothetical protein